jgi:hypothetical protein
MRIKELVQRRVSTVASGESLRALSRQEVQQVAGGLYFGLFDGPLPQPTPFPGNPWDHERVPGQYVA